MKIDKYGQQIYSENDLIRLYLTDPERIISRVITDKQITFSDVLELSNVPNIITYTDPNCTVEDFDDQQQNNWYMPDNYKQMDIAQWVLDQCKTEPELQRVGQELLLYQERDLFNLLRYLKWLVDIMTKNNLIWGVGRGSSVASYVLYKLGVHRIDSLHYELDPSEFLR